MGVSREFERCVAALVIMLAPLAPMFASELWAGIRSVPHKLSDQHDWVSVDVISYHSGYLFSVCLSVCLSVSLSLSACLTDRIVRLSVSICLSVSVALSVSVSFSLSASACLFPHPHSLLPSQILSRLGTFKESTGIVAIRVNAISVQCPSWQFYMNYPCHLNSNEPLYFYHRSLLFKRSKRPG